jgi:pyruvate kinase
MTRKTKIIATLGPASSTAAQIETLARAGADVFRLNFSHGTHADHQARANAIRQVEAKLGRPLGILLDLQGPKLRVGQIAAGKVTLMQGAEFRLDSDPTPGDATRAYLPHPEIFAALQPGHHLLIDDGKIKLRVTHVSAGEARTQVVFGGALSDRKGVNVPDSALAVSALTDKDKSDLAFGLALGVDWVALSFVQTAEDIKELRKLVQHRAGIIAKLEKPQALQCLDEIVAEADAVMVARGDLGVEMPPEDVPILQRRIVRACRAAGKPVVVATQMLESMITQATPTRAEASDVATAVYDGVDAVMLSAESASGDYSVEAVSMMARIITQVEADPLQRQTMHAATPLRQAGNASAIGAAVRCIADVVSVCATVTYTSSGATAMRVAHERPESTILGLSPKQATVRRLCLVWGVKPMQTKDAESVEEMVETAEQVARTLGYAVPGQTLVVVAGMPFGTPGSTNLLRLVAIPQVDLPST